MKFIKAVLMLFDYFKEAFRLNRTNKELYGPQIALILVRMALIAGIGIWAYSVLNGNRFSNLGLFGGDPWAIFRTFLGAAGLGLAGLLLWLLVVRMVEAGVFNMYKSAVQTGAVQPGAFWTGVTRFFLPFVLGDVVIGLGLLLLSPVWVLLGLITLSIGFAVGTIAIGVLLMFWKVSLVWNREGLIEAVRDSFRFAWSNKAALTVLYLVRRAFTSPFSGGGGGGGGNVSNAINLNNLNNGPGPISGPRISPEAVLNFLRIGVAIATPVLVIIVALAALVQMIFSVFFGLAMFVTYKHGFKPEQEVSPDVV